jgi:hypothetical protein
MLGINNIPREMWDSRKRRKMGESVNGKLLSFRNCVAQLSFVEVCFERFSAFFAVESLYMKGGIVPFF